MSILDFYAPLPGPFPGEQDLLDEYFPENVEPEESLEPEQSKKVDEEIVNKIVEPPSLLKEEDPLSVLDLSLPAISFEELLASCQFPSELPQPNIVEMKDFKRVDITSLLVPMFEHINGYGGTVNCAHCAMQVHRILKGVHTFADLIPAPVENANLFYPPPVENKNITQAQLTDQRIIQLCLKAFSEKITIDFSSGKPIEKIEELKENQFESGIRLLVCNRNELTERLLSLPRNENGQTRGFLFYTHRVGELGHVSNFFVNGEIVYYIDAQCTESNPVSRHPDFRTSIDDRVCYLQDRQDIKTIVKLEAGKPEKLEFSSELEDAGKEADIWYCLGLAQTDKVKSVECLEKAAELGHSEAQLYLARHFKLSGKLEQSSKWLIKAVQNNNENALKYLTELNSMSLDRSVPSRRKRRFGQDVSIMQINKRVRLSAEASLPT